MKPPGMVVIMAIFLAGSFEIINCDDDAWPIAQLLDELDWDIINENVTDELIAVVKKVLPESKVISTIDTAKIRAIESMINVKKRVKRMIKGGQTDSNIIADVAKNEVDHVKANVTIATANNGMDQNTIDIALISNGVKGGNGTNLSTVSVAAVKKAAMNKPNPTAHQSYQSPCHLDNLTDTDFVYVSKYKDESCYFMVKGATRESNPKRAIFNLTKAREICAKYVATLPIVKNRHENDFLASQVKKVQNIERKSFGVEIVLGLEKKVISGRSEFVWEDGSKLEHTFEAAWADWKYIDDPTFVTITLEGWWSRDPFRSLPMNVMVMCQKRYNIPTPPPMTTVHPLQSKCNQPNKKKYIKTAAFEGSCYFIVAGATKMTNAVDQENKEIFDIVMAREICQQEGAHLLTVQGSQRGALEAKFIWETFPTQGFDYKIYHYALGLRSAKPYNEIEYYWDDGTKFDTKFDRPDKWENEAQPAYYTIVSPYGKVTFRNSETEHGFGVGVICEQPHQDDPNLISTTTAFPVDRTTRDPKKIDDKRRTNDPNLASANVASMAMVTIVALTGITAKAVFN